jgi:hypothetical protein
MKNFAFIFCLVSSSAMADSLPNPNITPGETNPELTKSVVCDSRYRTGDVRKVSEATKLQVYKNYNVKNHEGYCSSAYGCEVDHLIPLLLGGSNSQKNLWPQPFSGEWNARMKDRLEVKLGNLVCSGKVSLEQAQKDISSNWIEAYKKYLTY